MKQAKQRFDSVWDAIEDSPGEAEAMKIRAQLLRRLQQKITDSCLLWAPSRNCRKSVGVNVHFLGSPFSSDQRL